MPERAVPAAVRPCRRHEGAAFEGNWEVGPRRGEASSTSVLGLYASGDCSIAAAARNGGLKKIGHVDYEYVNVVGIWQQATVIVYGE